MQQTNIYITYVSLEPLVSLPQHFSISSFRLLEQLLADSCMLSHVKILPYLYNNLNSPFKMP